MKISNLLNMPLTTYLDYRYTGALTNQVIGHKLSTDKLKSAEQLLILDRSVIT
jgi:hypothetical protein